jgi:hypothetical protein
VDDGTGALIQIGNSSRQMATIGKTATVLASGPTHRLDRQNTVEIELANDHLALVDVTMAQLAAGKNRALLGREIIQFAVRSRWAGHDGGLNNCFAAEAAQKPNRRSCN